MKLNKIGEVWNSAKRLLSDFFGLLSSKNFASMAIWRNNVSSLLRPWGGLFISNLFEGGLNRDGGLFNLEKMMVPVLHKEFIEYKVEKLKNKRVGGHADEDQNQIRTSSW